MSDSRKSFGEDLARLRHERGVGVDELARATKIRASLLRALESGSFEFLPPPVFVVGYLQAVARHLGADPEPLVKRYRHLAGDTGPGSPPAENGVPEETPERPRRHVGVWIGAGLAVAAVAVAGAIWVAQWRGPAPALEAPAAPPPPEMAVEVPKGVAALPGQEGAIAGNSADEAGPAAAGARSPLAGAEAQGPSAPAAPSGEAVPRGETAAPTSPAPAGDLVLDFSAPCWTEIWQGDERILRRQVQAGERLSFAGAAFKITLGDAASVRASFRGHPVALPAGPGRVVKDFAIPAAGAPGGEAP